jgi:D-alanyl-D-alanine carboxypeptidase
MVVRWKLLVAAFAVTLAACSGDDGDKLPSATGAPDAGSLAAADPAGGGSTSVAVSADTSTSTSMSSTTTSTLPPTTTAPPTTAPPTPPPAPPTTLVPTIEAAAWAVYDMASGQFLTSHEPDAQLPVGSVIKLLTAQTAYAAGNPVKIVKAPAGLLIDP